jgi:hypothetical protein
MATDIARSVPQVRQETRDKIAAAVHSLEEMADHVLSIEHHAPGYAHQARRSGERAAAQAQEALELARELVHLTRPMGE